MIMSILSDIYDGAVEFVSSMSTGNQAAQQTEQNSSTIQGIAGLFGAAMELSKPFVQDSVSRPEMPSNMTNVPDSVANDPRVQNLLGSYGFPNDMPEFKSPTNFERNFPAMYGALTNTVMQEGMDPTFDPAQLYGKDYTGNVNVNTMEQSRMLRDQSGLVELPRVTSYQDNLDYKARTFNSNMMSKLEPYQEAFSNAADKYDLDPVLLQALALTESSGRPAALSPKGASGLMQVTPDTAIGLMKKRNVTMSEAEAKEYLKDPVANIDLSAQLLKELNQKYNGDLEKVFADYNAGHKAVNNGSYRGFGETKGHYYTMLNMTTGINRYYAMQDMQKRLGS